MFRRFTRFHTRQTLSITFLHLFSLEPNHTRPIRPLAITQSAILPHHSIIRARTLIMTASRDAERQEAHLCHRLADERPQWLDKLHTKILLDTYCITT